MANKHIFSTGVLVVPQSTRATPMTATVRTGTTGSETAVPNAVDRNVATVVNFQAHGAAGFADDDQIIIDLGHPYDVASVLIRSVVLPNPVSPILVQVTNDKTSISAGTYFTSTPTVVGADYTYVSTAGSGQTVNGRYIILIPSNSNDTNTTLGEVVVTTNVTFAAVQSFDASAMWTRKDLYGPACNGVFAVDTADHEGKLDLKIQSASISAVALQLLVGSHLASVAGTPNKSVNTLPSQIVLPAFQAILQFYGTDGLPVAITIPNGKAHGVSMPFKLTDFIIEDFTITAYPDNNGTIATIVYQN